MTNTSGLSPLQSTPPTKSCLADFATLTDLYADIAAHMFFSPAAAQATKGDTGATGATGADGATGPAGPTGPDGAVGPSNYDIWLAAGNTGTLEQFMLTLTGPAGPAPTPTVAQKAPLPPGATFTDIQGTVGSHFFSLEYADPALTLNPSAMVPPNFPAISSIINLNNGFSRVYLTIATGNPNFVLVSSKFS